MQIASQKYDLFYFNCYGKHSYKSEPPKNKNGKTLIKSIRKDKIVKFNKYSLSFKELEFDQTNN